MDDDFMRDHFKIITVDVPVPAPRLHNGICVVCGTVVNREGSFGDNGEPFGTDTDARMHGMPLWIHDFCAEHASACKGVGVACTNVRHDHGGMVEEAANGGGPVPDSDQLHCADCGLPSHYDSGDEQYHHDDPKAPGCFLIGFAPSVIPHDPQSIDTRVAHVLTTYEGQIRSNFSDEWDTIKAVAECESDVYGAWGEVLDTAITLGYLKAGDDASDSSLYAALRRAFGLLQERLVEEVATR